jgi:diguanylate cyclase (GGDEF)-like protein
MDSLTALMTVTLMILLNGGVLGLMHRDLPAAVQPSAYSWRVATLLNAGGFVLIGAQALDRSNAFVLPLANAFLMFGLTGYWRALRQFDGLADTWWLPLPAAAGTLAVYWFEIIHHDLTMRVVAASLAWAWMLAGCIHTMQRGSGSADFSRRVLAGVFVAIAAFMVMRMLYHALGFGLAADALDNADWINIVTPMVGAVLPVIGTTGFLLLCSQRITRQWELAASTDYLTGLANRRTFADAGAARIAAARRQGVGAGVLVIDIDHFKQINDRYGHEVGDAALKHVAQRIETMCSSPDRPGRLGGEEFVAMLDTGDKLQAHAVAEALRRAIEQQPFVAAGSEETITVSIGVATLLAADRNLDDLLRRADQALYVAKSGGRNRAVLAP